MKIKKCFTQKRLIKLLNNGLISKNNYALFQPEITAYLNISTGYPLVDNEIRDYLKLFVNEKPQSQAKVTIAVGLPMKNIIINSKKSFTKKNYQWWFDDKIYYNGRVLGIYPYNGLVGGFKDDYNYIFVVGNDVDGLLAAVKRLISARSLFFSNFDIQRTSAIGDFDIAGISVADLLRNPSNWPYYNQRGSEMFANVVNRILNNNNFEISIKTVKTTNDNTTLRLKNIRSDFSANFTDAIIGNSKPVVLARGLWENLFSWNDFGKELAFDKENARDTWLIEIIGGPGQDCPTCPNYNYDDLVDYYWPALITGVQNYSGQKSLDYVGFSNGCRVGLDSARNWTNGKPNAGYVFDSVTGNHIPSNLGSNSVNTFIGIGCPGAFNGSSAFIDVFGTYGRAITNNFGRQNLNHISARQLSARLVEQCGSGIFHPICDKIEKSLVNLGDSSISLNLGIDYLNFIQDHTDKQPGLGLNINKFYIIYGQHPYTNLQSNSDGVVTSEDANEIFNSITSTFKNISMVSNVDHANLIESPISENYIRGYLK